jgi:hypothetical protein
MIIKRFFKQAPLLISVLAAFGLLGFCAVTVKAQASNIGSGGSTSIIGLPYGRSYFQNAASQAQSGTFNSPVGGASLLQENKTATLTVDAPAYTGSGTEPKVSGTNIWWAALLAVAAILSLGGIAVVMIPPKYWQVAEGEEGEQLSYESIAENPATDVEPTIPTADEVLPAEPQAPELPPQTTEPPAEVAEPSKVQVVDFTEEPPEPDKTEKKNVKHNGRPVKKSRK